MKNTGKKSLKWWIIALIALLVVAAVGVTLWLTLGNRDDQAADKGMKIYWNVERDQYVAKGEQGISARYPREDGNYYIRFAVDGEQVDLPVEGIELVNKIDSMKYMGLELNEAGVVVGAYHVDEFTGGLAADHYFVEAVDGTTVTVNTAGSMKGVSIDIEIPEGTPMYNVGQSGLLCGVPVQTLNRDDEVIAIKDLSGQVFLVYVMPYSPPGPIYWNINRMYDSVTGRTSRTSDGLGYYTYEFAYGGEIVKLRTRDAEVANAIDKAAAKCMGLEFDEEGLIIATTATGMRTGGGVIASWYHVMEVNGNEVIAERTYSGSEHGNVVTCRLTEHSQVVLTTTGEYTEPQLGDLIHCLTDSRGNIAYMFIVTRINENAQIGWNVERKWSSSTGSTSRVPDDDGYYHVTVASNGQQLKLKTTDKELVTAIDRSAAKCFAFEYQGDILTSVSGTGTATGGGVAMSWYTLDSVDENGNVTATKRNDTKNAEYGMTVTKKMAEDCKIYNVASTADMVGEETQLQDGDIIHCLTNLQGELHTIFVVTRPVDVPIYWNVNRMYNSTTKQTTRTPEADGFYHFELCGLGKTWDLKVRTKEMATQIDSNAGRCWGLRVWNGEVTEVLYTSSTVKGAGGVQVSWCNITRVTQYSAQAIKHGNGTEDGNTYVIDYAYGCKFYDVSNNFKEVRGEESPLRVGDLVHCMRNSEGKTTIVWIISRGPENGYMDYCNMCKQEVLWSAWDGTTALAAGVHYYLQDDVHMDTFATTSGGKISLFLNGHTLSSDSRVLRLNSGTTLNIYDSMEDGSDIGGKIIGRGLTTEEAKAEANGSSEGGVIILWGSNTLNLYSGTLELADDHNTVHSGGVLAGNGTFNMYGGKLTGGEVTNSGGTMRRYGANTVTNIYGGIMENGTAGTSGGHISTGGAGNKLNIYGGTFTGGSAKGAGDDVWHDKGTYITLGGKVVLSDLHINNTATVKTLEEGSSISVTCGDPTVPFAILENAGDAKYFHSADPFMDVEAKGNELYLVSNLTNQVHCVCGGHAKGVGDHTACQDIEWTPWTSTTTMPTTSGNYYLMVDVTAPGFTMTGGDDIKICLNGHTMTATSAIWLRGNYTVTDCIGTGAIYSTRSGHSNVFYTYELCNLYLYAGTISGEKAGGKNYSVISLCDDDWDGDGTRETSYFRMYGGKIIGRDAGDKDGAGIYMMRGGEFTMYGGTITGGKTNKAGAAVFLGSSSCKVNLLGGSITGNAGAGAVFASVGKLTIGGDMQITGNTNFSGTAPSNVRLHGTMKMDLSGLGSGAKLGINMYNPGVFAENVSDLTKQITSDNDAYKVVFENNTLALESKAPAHEHCICNGNAKGVGDHTACQDIQWQPWTSTTSLPNTAGNYYLTGNVKLTAGVRINDCTINLCLNGYDITSESRVYRMGSNAKLYITDHKTGSSYGGTVTGMGLKESEIAGDANGNSSEGGVFMQYNTTTDLRIYGGNFEYVKATDGRTPVKNGGILQGGGTFKLYDGVLTGADVTLNGCVLRSWGEKTRWYLYGGTLIGAKAANTGGAVAINAGKAGAELYIGSVTVKNGSAGKAGGIYIDGYCSKITLAGNPQIVDNRNGNLFLSTGKVLTLDSSLKTTAKVGISMQTLGKFATARTAADKDIFSSDSGYAIYLDGLELHMNNASAVPHKHCVCAGNYSGTGHSHSELSWNAWDGTGDLTSGNYYLTGNVKRAAITINSGDTIRICLNGYTIDSGTDRALRIFGNVVITDCSASQTGLITTARTALAPLFYVQSAASFELYGGTLKATGKVSQAGVGAVSDENASGTHVSPGTMSVYGGTITGGYTTSGDAGLIALWNKTTLNIYGGKLTNGYSAKNGGLIAVGSGCFLNIYGGELSNGTAANVGDAISLAATAKLTLSGSPVFTGNDGEDIWDMGNSNITVSNLGSSVRIIINATDERTLATNVTTDVSTCFQSANSDYQVVWENNTLVFKKK